MKTFHYITIALALLVLPLVVAYPSVRIVTDTVTSVSPITVIAGSTSDPYVSGADYSLSRTYDYVDGYRAGYSQAAVDTSYSPLNHYYGPGMDCDANHGVCFYHYEPCGDHWCRAGDPWQRSWYDTNIVYARQNLFPTTSYGYLGYNNYNTGYNNYNSGYSYYTTQRTW